MAQDKSIYAQFLSMKKKHPDAILLLKVGEFYEIFDEDATASSQILGISLMKRVVGVGKMVNMAGFPHTMLELYLPKLVRAGKRIAILEELEAKKKQEKPKFQTAEVVIPAKKSMGPQEEAAYKKAIIENLERAMPKQLSFDFGSY